MSRRIRESLPLLPFFALVTIFLIVPTATVIVSAFFVDGAFSLARIAALFSDTALSALWKSVLLSASTAIIGAALGAVLAFVLGLAQSHMMWVPALSCLGAVLSLAVVYALTTRRGRTPVAMLLLAGVALNALLGAATAFVITLQWVRYEVAQEVLFWLMGGLEDRTWTHVWMAAPLVAVGLASAAALARDLDLFTTGEDAAATLGLDVERAKQRVLAVAAILTGTAVAVCGVIGFVGLIVPHALRLVVGPSHRRLVPAAAMAGAIFVVAADLVARTALAPAEIRLGVVTGLCGAPFFLWLLARGREGWS